MPNPPPLCLTMGDPAGCGPAITMAAWSQLRTSTDCGFYVRGAPDLYTQVPTAIIASPSQAPDAFPDALPVLPLDTVLGPVQPGAPSPEAVPSILNSISGGVGDVLVGEASGIVTNPISKALLTRAGFGHPGHTEYLAELSARSGLQPDPVMMLVGGGLRVALATIHLPLRDAINSITRERLVKVARIVHQSLMRDFGLETPRIVFTGINPHAGEDGTLGREEIDIVNPAAAALRAEGIDIADARPADTVFAESLAGRFDAVIAMTHDQGLIPVKTLDLWGGVNTTLGLPIVRTSPDHGTAYEAAATDTARPDSLIAAIRLAAAMASSRAQAANG
ncbi:MAG: 4-hydroxythreonine-4-phosphate dehydrogenase PdxA [Pseudomonadota bacterium]